MTTNEINQESIREKRWYTLLAAVLAAGGILMTIYSARIITGLIVRWSAYLY